MRRIAVIKVGSTLPVLIPVKGDFTDWILRGMQVGQEECTVLDVAGGAELPKYDDLAGVVITGSHTMVTEHQPWSERTAAWLPGVVERNIPLLGICYGHQLLAYALGGQVDNNPNGREYGTVEARLTSKARNDRLLGGFAAPIKVHAGHVQSVLKLPQAARRLAYSSMDENLAFGVGECAWGVQFHPEYDAEVVRAYIDHNKATLQAEGQDPNALTARSVDTAYGGEILRRFAAITKT